LFASNHAAGKADPFGSHDDDVLALQELLRDGGGETAEHVALRVDDDDRFVRRLLFFLFHDEEKNKREHSWVSTLS
jgi:hypothetical protein